MENSDKQQVREGLAVEEAAAAKKLTKKLFQTLMI